MTTPIHSTNAYSLDEDASLDVAAADGVLENDSGLLLSVALLDDVQHGNLTLRADGSFAYSPIHDFNGLDSFVYEVTDGLGRIATGSVSLTVHPVNDPPTASDDGYDVNTYGSGYVLHVLTMIPFRPKVLGFWS